MPIVVSDIFLAWLFFFKFIFQFIFQFIFFTFLILKKNNYPSFTWQHFGDILQLLGFTWPPLKEMPEGRPSKPNKNIGQLKL